VDRANVAEETAATLRHTPAAALCLAKIPSGRKTSLTHKCGSRFEIDIQLRKKRVVFMKRICASSLVEKFSL
jgi:hypothetical protein